MSNIEFIDGTVRVGDIAHIMAQEYAAIKTHLSNGSNRDIDRAVNLLVFGCGYSPAIAELIVYELI